MVIISDLGYTPICNLCGVTLCWDISEEEYLELLDFWDAWCCKECDPETVEKYAAAKRKNYEKENISTRPGRRRTNHI